MARVLVSNYNASVKPNDIVYFLGDMGLTKSDEISKVIKKLNGTKLLILGNHDKGPYAMRKMGFDAVMYGSTLKIGNELVTLSHCPLKGIQRENIEGMRGAQTGEHWHGEKKNNIFTRMPHKDFHLHGHIHSPNSGKSVRELNRQYDVGVDANKYRPVSLGEIESWIAKTKRKEAESGKEKN